MMTAPPPSVIRQQSRIVLVLTAGGAPRVVNGFFPRRGLSNAHLR
jgi:hypothetical protein